jgi:hypothetical protein
VEVGDQGVDGPGDRGAGLVAVQARLVSEAEPSEGVGEIDDDGRGLLGLLAWKATAGWRQRLLDLTDPAGSGLASHRARHSRGELGLHDRGRVVEAWEDLAVDGTDLVRARRRFEGTV